MTITGLFSILHAPVLQPLPPTLAVDAPCWIVEALQSPSLRSLHRSPVRYLFFVRASALLAANVAPTFVFDRARPGSDFDNHQSAARSVASALGCVCLLSPGTAESLCCSLLTAGKVEGVASRDSDCFAHGAGRVFVRVTAAMIRGGRSGEAVDGDGMGQRGAVVHALLAGSDETKGVIGVGSKGAEQFLRDCRAVALPDPIDALRRLGRGEGVAELKREVGGDDDAGARERRTDRLQKKLPRGFPPQDCIDKYFRQVFPADGGESATKLDDGALDDGGLAKLLIFGFDLDR